MAAWPRTITRGQLKGETYATEHAYRKALAASLGKPTRAEQRNILAKKLGFKSYAERRKAKETIGEKKYLAIKKTKGGKVAGIVAREKRQFNQSTKQQRIQRVTADLNKYGSGELGANAYLVWDSLYKGKA